jgi:ATP-dependent Clp protease ATP-binding subunit ClpB
MVRGERHEIYHRVRIADSAIEAAVALSDRYVSGRYLPDKAIDLIDEAASRVRIGIDSAPHDLDQVARAARRVEIELIALTSRGEATPRRDQLDEELAGLQAQAAAMTGRWRAEQQAIAAIQAIKNELAAKRAEAARHERAGNLARQPTSGTGKSASSTAGWRLPPRRCPNSRRRAGWSSPRWTPRRSPPWSARGRGFPWRG